MTRPCSKEFRIQVPAGILFVAAALVVAAPAARSGEGPVPSAPAAEMELRAGAIGIGLDTSHATAFAALFTVMGPGCESVTRISTSESELVVGR